MKKIISNKNLLVILVLILSVLSLYLYTKLDSFSVASTNPEATIELGLSKYLNYNEVWGRGTLFQYNLKTEIHSGDDKKIETPVKNTQVTIATPQINGNYPDSVTVIAKDTKATNNNIGGSFTNYNYDAKTGKIIINVSNEDEKGNPINTELNEEALDEFEIITNYGETAYSEENVERQLTIQASVINTLFNDNNVVEKYGDYQVILSENNGNIVSVNKTTNDIYNGYIKSNIINGTEYRTFFDEIDEIQISNKKAQNRIQVTESNSNITFKSSMINKEDMQNVLGKDGIVEILDLDGNVLATLNSENNTINYESEPEAIVIRTSNILNEGILRIQNFKEIKTSTDFINNNTAKINNQIIGFNNEDISYEIHEESDLEVKDAQTNIDLQLNNEEWTNEKQNDVTFDLKLNSNGNQYNLFKNPTIKIELPSEVEKVLLEESSMVYGNGLELQNVVAGKNENGNIEIIASLVGSQTEYNENDIGLMTSVKIPATIILKKDLDVDVANINVTYTNEYYNTETRNFNKEIAIDNYQEDIEDVIQAEQEKNAIFTQAQEQGINATLHENITNIVKAENLENINLDLEVVPQKGENILANGDVVYEGEFIKYNVKITNNSNEDAENVKLKAEIPEGLTYGELDADYYNADGKYEYKFEDETRNKEIEIGTIKAGKSYTGIIELRADNLNGENEKQLESAIQAFIGENEVTEKYSLVSTIKAAEAQVFLSASLNPIKDSWYYTINIQGNDEAELVFKGPEGFKFEYFTQLNNNSGEEAAGTKISEDDYSVSENIVTANLQPGTYTIGGIIDSKLFKEYETPNYEVDLKAYATIKVNHIDYVSNENRIKVKYEHVSITMESENEGEEVNYEDEITYKILVKNDGGTNLQNEYFETAVNVRDYLPEYVDPVSVTYETWEQEIENAVYDDNGKLVSFNNTGRYNKKEVTESLYITEDENGNDEKVVNVYVNIPYGQSVNILVKAKVGIVLEKTTIENNATASDTSSLINTEDEKIEAKTSNTIRHYINPLYGEEEEAPYVDPNVDGGEDEDNNPNNPDDSDNQNNQNDQNNSDNSENNTTQKYSISGLVWLDENKNGKRDGSESTVSDISMILVDTNNSSNVKARTSTSVNGIYNFKNLEQGNYIVIFEYNTYKYSITTYKKSGVLDSQNSDAQSDTITLNGEQKIVGLTDVISLNNDQTNIDLGLIENDVKNLKIEKYINKVTVNTNKRTKEKSYNKEKLAKTEIRAKEIEGATVTVEYKIIVTNNGNNATNIGQITDYIPEGFTYSQSQNSSWTSKNSNEVINTSTTNKELKAGEKIEFNLVLTKQMTEKGTGTFTNMVKVGESTDKADIIISIGTGSAILYISVIVGALTCLFVGIYLIRKIGISNISKVGMMLIITIMFLGTNNLSSDAANTPQVVGFLYDHVWNGNELTRVYDQQRFASENHVVGNAICIQHGVYAAEPDASGRADREHYVDRTYERMVNATTTVKVSGKDYNLTRKNSIADLKVLDSGEYLFGPFIYETNATNAKYSVEIRNALGVALTKYSICDSNGNLINNNKNYEITEDNGNKDRKFTEMPRTFYIKTTRGQCWYGVVSVKLIAEIADLKTTEVVKTGKIVYSHEKYQNLETYNEYPEPTSKDPFPSADKGKLSITWPLKGRIEVTKIDADDDNVKLKGVTLNLSYKKDGDTYTYDETKETNEKGIASFENLMPGKVYTLTEKSNTNYGYELTKNAENLAKGSITLRGGTTQSVLLPNIKNTGNLTIEKVDLSSNKPLKGIGFKIKDSNNQYIKVTDSSNNEEKLVVNGSIDISNITKVDKIDEGTEFITGEDGKVTIRNILTGKYTIEETSLGDYSDIYKIDGENISWRYNGKTVEGTETGNGVQITVDRQKSYDTTSINTGIIKDAQKTIPDGVYTIESCVDSTTSRVLDADGNKPYPDTNIQLWHSNGTLAQKYYVKYLGGGEYNLINIGSSLKIDLNGGVSSTKRPHSNPAIIAWKQTASDTSNNYTFNGKISFGENVHLWPSNGSDAQKWSIIKDGNYYKIKSNLLNGETSITGLKNRDLVIDVQNAGTEDETNIDVWQINGSIAQIYSFIDQTGYEAKETTDKVDMLTVSNRKEYIKISGNVWEEGLIEGKTNEIDSIFTDNDIKLQNIKVTLKNNDGTDAQTTYTDENGKYSFDKVAISKLKDYYVEFEYDGEIYTTIQSFDELGYENSREDVSKVQEVSDERKAVDENYAKIAGTGEVNTTNNTSKSDVSNRSQNFNVNYNSYIDDEKDAYSVSKNIETMTSGLSEDGKTRNVNKFENYENYDKNKITANTKEIGYSLLAENNEDYIREHGIEEITNINCGLAQREQVDLSVSLDIENVIVSVNGYTNTYTYQAGKKYDTPEKFRLDVKSNSWGYERRLYASDICEIESDTFQIYITYAMLIENKSYSLSAKVDKITNYHDSNYSFVKAGTTTELKGDITWKNVDANKGEITNIPEIGAGESTTIYIQYKLNNEAAKNVLNGDLSTENTVEIEEYSSYYGDKTYYHTGNGSRKGIYASIDKDSAPGNAIYGNKSTYEDDTMKAPVLTMKLTTNERTISGNVFEDIKGENGLGDGIYNKDNDRQVGNVLVELYEYKQPEDNTDNSIWTESIGNIAQKWRKKDDNTYEKIKATATTDANGSYSISGIIPGQYVLKYTYGNGNVIYKGGTEELLENADRYKSTIITSDVIKTELEKNPKQPSMWYKEIEKEENEYSVAADDKNSYNSGIQGDGETRTINHNYLNQASSILENKAAYSAPMNIKFELTDNNGDGKADTDDPQSTITSSRVTKVNSDGTEQIETVLTYKNEKINFGIVEKPKQDYSIVKNIENVKITLANGQTLIDGNPSSQNIQYVKYMLNTPFDRANTVNIEIDNELITGATLEITYKVTAENKSETNYNTYEYYYFGTEPEDKSTIDEIQSFTVIDYLDPQLVYSNENNPDNDGEIYVGKINGEHKFVVPGSKLDGKPADEYLFNNVIVTAEKYSNLLILENGTEWTFKASKVLAVSDELEFTNYVECIEYETTGVPTSDNTPGNFDPVLDSEEITQIPGEETDHFGSVLPITGPTGENRNYVVYIVVVAGLIVLASGIIIIRKKVL